MFISVTSGSESLTHLIPLDNILHILPISRQSEQWAEGDRAKIIFKRPLPWDNGENELLTLYIKETICDIGHKLRNKEI